MSSFALINFMFWSYVLVYWLVWRKRYGYAEQKVRRILTYHKVETRFEFGGTRLSPNQFRRQMARLHKRDWKTASLTEYAKHLSDKAELDSKTFIITFDDGFSGVLKYAAPTMAEFDYTGSVYIITDFAGKDNSWDLKVASGKFRHLNWDEISELADLGWEIGSHTVSHRSLLTLSDDELKYELATSKDIIEQKLGIECSTISLPYGHADLRIVEAVADAGYTICLGLYVERLNAVDDVRLLHRTGVYVIDGPKAVSAKVGDFGDFLWGVEDLKGRMGGWYADLALRLSEGKNAPREMMRGRDIYMNNEKSLI